MCSVHAADAAGRCRSRARLRPSLADLIESPVTALELDTARLEPDRAMEQISTTSSPERPPRPSRRPGLRSDDLGLGEGITLVAAATRLSTTTGSSPGASSSPHRRPTDQPPPRAPATDRRSRRAVDPSPPPGRLPPAAERRVTIAGLPRSDVAVAVRRERADRGSRPRGRRSRCRGRSRGAAPHERGVLRRPAAGARPDAAPARKVRSGRNRRRKDLGPETTSAMASALQRQLVRRVLQVHEHAHQSPSISASLTTSTGAASGP